MPALMERICRELESFTVRVGLMIPYDRAAVLSQLHDHGRIISEVYGGEGIRVQAEVPRSAALSLSPYLESRAPAAPATGAEKPNPLS